MRILYYVPIAHTKEDYGVLGGIIQKTIEENPDPNIKKYLEEQVREIQDFWKLAKEEIIKEVKDFRGVRIYQDSFPVPVGERDKILQFFGYLLEENPKSPNFLLIKELLARGAILEGTEDFELVKEHLEIYLKAVRAQTREEQSRILMSNALRSKELIQKRDEFIAKRINETLLPEDGKGLLLIGGDHRVIQELDKLEEAGKLIFPIKVISFSRKNLF